MPAKKYDFYEVKNLGNLNEHLFHHEYKKRCIEWIKHHPKAQKRMMIICGVKIEEYYDNQKLMKL
jgi:hypothetical protein